MATNAGASTATGAQLPLVLETKFWPPLVRAGALPRAGLIEALQKHIDAHTVTLVSAGAGFGKTSLLAAWFASQPLPESVAWMTVDAADNDPVQFWAYIAESLRRTYRARLADAASPLPSSTEGGIAILVNELAAVRAPRVLVLDDFHLLTHLVCSDAVDAFIAALPPKARVVIASRVDPPISLARLRARGQLGELRARDLAFNSAEARALVDSTPQAHLGTRDAERLRRRTEGWPAGMYLALLAATHHDDPHTFVQQFTGGTQTIADFLGGEVLGRLDESTRSFLVRTSVLDVFSGPVCDATLATTGSAKLLRELAERNLFLVPLDDRLENFRYHQLFRDLLLLEFSQLDTETRTDNHRRASSWYEDAGGRPERAIHHALAAEDWPRAANLVLQSAFGVVRTGRWLTVLNWISALPEQEILARPLLPAFAVVIVTSLRADRDEIAHWLAVCAEAKKLHPDRWPPEAEVCVTYPAAVVATDVGAAVDAAARLVEAGKSTTLRAQTIAHGLLAWNRFLAGDLEGSVVAANAALADEHALGWATGRMHAYAVLSFAAGRAGDSRRALELAEQSAASAHEFDVYGTAIATRARLALAYAAAAAGRLDYAEREALAALGADGKVPKDASSVFALIVLASIRRRRGRLDSAREALDRAERALLGFVDAGRLQELVERVRWQVSEAEAAAWGTEELSPGEINVLRLLASSLSRKEIAAELFLSPNTVKTHCRAIYRKLRVTSRADAVARAHDLGLLGDGSPG